MKRMIGMLMVVGVVAGIAVGAESSTPLPGLVPRPQTVVAGEGRFELSANTVIVAGQALDFEAKYLGSLLRKSTGYPIKSASWVMGRPALELRINDKRQDLGDEGYSLVVEQKRVIIEARNAAGVFYGIQTLRQLLPVQVESTNVVTGVSWIIPCVAVTDQPRFQWRGYLLDTGRHFRSKEFLLKTIDRLAYHKLNVLQWHLTEDQGWRIEIKKYPKLTEIGAWRGEGDKRHGGFYTQDDIREVVAYAKSRHVTVVPEIEMPGHSVAALAAYPELSCSGGPFKVSTKWGVHDDVFCAGNDKVFEFEENVLSEVMELFPSKVIHIGGDECNKKRWKECAKCQARIKAEGLKNEAQLQSYFIKRIEKVLSSKGRRLIGWDEILDGGMDPTVAVTTWRPGRDGVNAARKGHDVVMSPYYFLYLDSPNTSNNLAKVYTYEPVSKLLTPEQERYIIGAQCNMWCEGTPLESDIDRYTWPRLAALSEIVWSSREQRNWPDFLSRLPGHVQRLRAWGIECKMHGSDQTILGIKCKGGK